MLNIQWINFCICYEWDPTFTFFHREKLQILAPFMEYTLLCPLIWLATAIMYPCSPRDSQESSPWPQFESMNSLALSLLNGLTLTSIHDYWKNHGFDYTPLSAEWCLLMSLNTLSRFVTAFLPRSKCLLISWLSSPSTPRQPLLTLFL